MDKLHSLGFLLNRASFQLAKNLRDELNKDKINLPHSQFVVLRCLSIKDSISQQEIARLLCKDAAAIKRTLDNLEAKKLIKRTSLTQRENSILITEAGRNIIPKAMNSGEKVIQDVKNSLGEENYNQLIQLLEKIYKDN